MVSTLLRLNVHDKEIEFYLDGTAVYCLFYCVFVFLPLFVYHAKILLDTTEAEANTAPNPSLEKELKIFDICLSEAGRVMYFMIKKLPAYT